MNDRPSGFISLCPCGCGSVIGAMDYDRTGRVEAGKMLGGWLFDGRTVVPRYGQWQVEMSACKKAATPTGEGGGGDASTNGN